MCLSGSGWSVHRSHHSLLPVHHLLWPYSSRACLLHWRRMQHLQFLKKSPKLSLFTPTSKTLLLDWKQQVKSQVKFGQYQPEIAVSQASLVAQIVSQDFLRFLSLTSHTHLALITLHFPDTTGPIKQRAFPLMAWLFNCLQGCFALNIFASRIVVQIAWEKWLFIYTTVVARSRGINQISPKSKCLHHVGKLLLLLRNICVRF